jgi:23S rRNA pseudouridine2605 synthase
VRQYRARARGKVTQADLDKLKEGVVVDGVSYGPIEATLDKAKESKSEDGKAPANLWISVSITEGKNREVRKVLESVGLTVNRLIRLAYGPFRLDVLPVGAVEEVGPRVIRELLGEHIRPENLPTGNTVETPAPIPGRRLSIPIVKGRSGSAMSDPSRKPSRVRAAETAQADAIERRERPAKKEGWAKAKPKTEHPKRVFKPREGAPPEGERPARAYKPREGAPTRGGDGPKREYKPRTAGPDFKPRSGGASGGRDFKPRSGGKPAGPSGTSGRAPGGKPRTPRS